MIKYLLIAVFLLVGVASKVFTRSSGAPAGNTGAPGETNCSNPNCHGGDVSLAPARPKIFLIENGDTVEAIRANTDYTLAISYSTGANTARGGFQVVALNGSNTNVGTLTVGSGSRIVTGNNKSYLTHSTPKTGAVIEWNATWNSGSVTQGQTITFYAASRSTVQVAGLSSQAYPVTASVQVFTQKEHDKLVLYPTLVTESATLTGDFLKPISATIGVYNVRGQMVQEEKLQIGAGAFSHLFKPEARLLPGDYVLRLSTSNFQKTFRFKKI